MHNRLSYADLEEILSRLGFHPVSVIGKQKVFENAPWHAIILLPPYQGNEPVRPHHLVTVRTTIVGKGIVDADAFEDLVAERLLARA